MPEGLALLYCEFVRRKLLDVLPLATRIVVDPTAKRSAMISGPDTLNLYGIYGLQFSAGSLVVTQSGFSPQRIVRLELNPDGATVGNVVPMASALESFDSCGIPAGIVRGLE